jgi:hypothetical protein
MSTLYSFCFLDDGDYVLKPNLVEGLNFALIPEDAFEKLNTAYGVKDENRDIIKRRVVSGTVLSKEPFIEIYLRDLKVKYIFLIMFSNWEFILSLKIANFAKRDEVVTIQISHGDSVERIQQKMMEALDLNMTNLNRARFITEESGGRFEQLPPQISNIRLSSLLTSGITIFVDSTGNASLDDPNGNKRNSS